VFIIGNASSDGALLIDAWGNQVSVKCNELYKYAVSNEEALGSDEADKYNKKRKEYLKQHKKEETEQLQMNIESVDATEQVESTKKKENTEEVIEKTNEEELSDFVKEEISKCKKCAGKGKYKSEPFGIMVLCNCKDIAKEKEKVLADKFSKPVYHVRNAEKRNGSY